MQISPSLLELYKFVGTNQAAIRSGKRVVDSHLQIRGEGVGSLSNTQLTFPFVKRNMEF